MKLTRNWFGTPEGTEVIATGETVDMTKTRIIVISRADGEMMQGPSGPRKEGIVEESFLDEAVGPQRSRDIFEFI